MDRAQRRLAAALGASALLHLWLVHSTQGSQLQRVPRAVTGGSVAITVLLKEPLVDFLAPDVEPRIARATGREIIPFPAAIPAISAAMAVRKSVERPVVQALADAADGGAALPQPSDPTYYSALSLDVYPTAVTALDLGALLAAGRYAAGQARATVLIDESGLVNEIRSVEAVARDIESAARELLLHTRFTPARKDGRIVKAQVRVSLDYGTR